MTPSGLLAPILTPFNDDLSVADDLYVAHAQSLMEQGCGGLVPFGTTGEALSVGIDERQRALEALVDGGVLAERLIPGTGLTNLPDTMRLTRHAIELGCAGTLVLPPFYYKDPADDGLVAHLSKLVESVGGPIFLYHIPQVAGVGFPVDVVRRLRDAFPEQVVGIKDSSGDWDNTRQLFDIEGLDVFPGSELWLLDALKLGGPGCITATANLNAKAIVEVIDLYRDGDLAAASDRHEEVVAKRRVFADYAPIPAQKFLLAESTGDSRWANLRPPLTPISAERGRELQRQLGNTVGAA